VPNSIITLAAILLDLIIGDPRQLPHPIRWMGSAIRFFDALIRRVFKNQLRFGGATLWSIIVGGSIATTYAIIMIANIIHPFLGMVVKIIIIAYALSWKSLTDEGRAILKLLNLHDQKGASSRLQTIVHRDCRGLSESGIIRGAIETLTENCSDGIIAPLFYAILGGAPLAMAYKAINTLDSMIGYQNEKYRDLGWFSARADDVANFIPARITGALFVVTAWLLRDNPTSAIRAWKRDAQKGPSPNGGIPIVTFAGAKNIRLGGDCLTQEGERISIPFVGGERIDLRFDDISAAIRYINVTSILSVIISTVFLQVL
jgi:adenosylcobinamide-phosphate synthase